MLSEERRRQLGAALSKLPERQRLVFMLSHFEGRSSREVSAMTGLNESTVRVHLFRAIRGCGRCSRAAPAPEASGQREDQSCGSLMRCFVRDIFPSGRSSKRVMTGDRPAHLDRCDICAERAVELGRWLDDVRATGVEAADAAFSARAARGAAGADSRRLEQLDEPARVIAFPEPVARRAARRRRSPRRAGVGRRRGRRGSGARRRRRPGERRGVGSPAPIAPVPASPRRRSTTSRQPLVVEPARSAMFELDAASADSERFDVARRHRRRRRSRQLR